MNVTIKMKVPDQYILCLCHSAKDQLFIGLGLTAIFEVKDVYQLALSLKQSHPNLLGNHEIASVRYEKSEFVNLQRSDAIADVFVKRQEYIGENELRVAWNPAATDAPVQHFTSDCPAAAECMSRIA